MMNRFLSLFLSALLFTACFPDSLSGDKSDEADAFVGTYTFSAGANVTWGGDSGLVPTNGKFFISKTSANEVRISGYYSTTGTVDGKNLYMKAYTSSSSDGVCNYAFSVATLSGKTLSFRVDEGGKLKYNGVLYPYTSTMTVTALRE